MIKKLFCACIYLYQGSAVRNLQDHTVVDNDAARLAAYYCNNNADRIIVFDDGKIDGVVIQMKNMNLHLIRSKR